MRRTVALLLMLLATAAVAEPDRKAAAAHFQRGIELYEKNDYSTALDEFRAAYAEAPSFEVLYNIGLCQRWLLKYGEAVNSFQEFLKQGGAKIPKQRRAQAREQLQQVLALTGTVIVTANGAPAEVLVDGEPVGFTPLTGLLLGPGWKSFAVRREGFVAPEQMLEVKSGATLTVEFELLPASPPNPQPAPQPNPAVTATQPIAASDTPVAVSGASHSGQKSVTGGVVLMGVGAVALGAAVGLNVISNQAADQISRLYSAGGTWTADDAEAERRGTTTRTLAVIGYVGGGALLVAGAVVTIVTLAAPAEPKAEVSVVPLPGGGGYASVRGAF